MGPEELEAKVGSHRGHRGWHTASQEPVDVDVVFRYYD